MRGELLIYWWGVFVVGSEVYTMEGEGISP